jgi:itaconyl-CoA hydratase
MTGPISRLTGNSNWFEDFAPGQKFRHARGATVGEAEGQVLAKLVMNTAQAHWNEDFLTNSPLGSGRVVFGLITASIVVGLASQDTSENALSDVALDGLRFRAPVHHGDTLYAYTEVLETTEASERVDAGLVRFKHWGVSHRGDVVFEGERTVLIKKRRDWEDR